MLPKSPCTQRVAGGLRLHPRKSALPIHFLRLLLVVWWSAVAALGQSQSQSPTQSQPQSHQKEESLADAARKARAKKGKSEPVKVYTEEDLSKLGSGSVSVVGQETPVAAASPESTKLGVIPEASDAANSGQKDEEYWRGRARELLEQMAAVDQDISQVKDDIKKYGNAGFDPWSGLTRNVIYVDDRNSRLKKLEKQKADLVKKMDLLQEEGRKAGALPAWFR